MVPSVTGISISLKTGIRNKNTRAALVEIRTGWYAGVSTNCFQTCLGPAQLWRICNSWRELSFHHYLLLLIPGACWMCAKHKSEQTLPALLTVITHWKLLWACLEMHMKNLDWGQWPWGTELCQQQPPTPAPGQAQGSELCSPGNYSYYTRTGCLWGRGKKKCCLIFSLGLFF